jgi:hypothetical protein
MRVGTGGLPGVINWVSDSVYGGCSSVGSSARLWFWMSWVQIPPAAPFPNLPLAFCLLSSTEGDLSDTRGRRLRWRGLIYGLAQVIIPDEPTAALDARVEYEVFARFAELVSGQMALLISHRFPTVRMADRIIVLRGGTVAEEGTHDELVARKGLYAELFSLQSEGYR